MKIDIFVSTLHFTKSFISVVRKTLWNLLCDPNPQHGWIKKGNFIESYRGANNMKSYPPAAGQRKGQAGPIATASIIVNTPLQEQPVKR